MKNRHRPVPSFPAAIPTIEAPSEAVFHPGTGVLAAEAAHHEAVEAPEVIETTANTPEELAEAPESVSATPATDLSDFNADGSPVNWKEAYKNEAQLLANAEHNVDVEVAIANKAFDEIDKLKGRDENDVPPVVGLGDGTINSLSEFVPAPPLDELTQHINGLLGEEEPDEEIDRFEAELNIAAELKTFMGDGIVDLPDGGILTAIKVDADKKEILMAWAEGAGESFPDYLQKILEMGLEAVVNGGAVAG